MLPPETPAPPDTGLIDAVISALSRPQPLDRDLRRELARSARYGRCFSLVLIDLDGLKAVNDQQGHPTGDLMLQRIAADLAESMRAGDGAYRIGGDEFALVLPETEAD